MILHNPAWGDSEAKSEHNHLNTEHTQHATPARYPMQPTHVSPALGLAAPPVIPVSIAADSQGMMPHTLGKIKAFETCSLLCPETRADTRLTKPTN